MLRPSGVLIVEHRESAVRQPRSVAASHTEEPPSARQEDASTLQAALLLAGFTAIERAGSRVRGSKPAWEAGAAQALRKRAAPAAAPPAPAWLLNADDDDELIDEDALLTEEDRQRPAAPVSDCEVSFRLFLSFVRCSLTRPRAQVGTTGRKACANCSCGRAEAEAKVTVENASDLDSLPPSACGSVRARLLWRGAPVTSDASMLDAVCASTLSCFAPVCHC